MKWNDNGIVYTREWMRANGYNQAQFSKRFNISASSLSKMLKHDQDKIEDPTIDGLCKAFKLTKRQLEDIIEGVPPEQVKKQPTCIDSSLDPALIPFFNWLSAQDDAIRQPFLGMWNNLQNLSNTSGNSPPAQETQRKRVG